ncbi:MAG: OmpA family protein [Verrucomicrobia bacterium]|nr:OmpA family protein [Verrucomicrobiota bacterium]
MPKQTWIVATILSALVILAFVGLSVLEKTREVDRLRDELEHARAALAARQTHAEQLKETLTQAQEQIAALQATEQKQSSLEQQMRAALESKDITISQLQGKLTVSILDRILFDSGEADVKPEGHEVLRKIAGLLAQVPNRQIHVVGHTDNVPITGNLARKYPTNWELSAARATAAVRFLHDHAGVDARRLGAVGYGEFQPLADNSTPEGRARNRRIAIVVLPEEITPSDVKPSATGETGKKL